MNADLLEKWITTFFYLAFPGLWINRVVETGLIAQTEDLLQKKHGVVPKNGVQGKVIQVPVFFTLVVTEVDEIFNVVMGPNVFYILKKTQVKDILDILN